MNDPTWIQAVSAIAQSVIALATLLLSLVLWGSSKRHARADYMRTLEESWNQLNATILANPKLLTIADSVFGISIDGVPEDRARRYFAFFALNILEASYLGQTHGLVENAYHMNDILDRLLSDPEIAKLLYVWRYQKSFVEHCEQRIKDLPGHRNDGFLRTAPGIGEPLARRASRLCTGGYCGWKRTMRQAHSTNAARTRGLPRLVTLPGTRLLPLLCSPGQSPV